MESWMLDVRSECEVVVVGAGPAGMAAASLCARAGLATVLFDQHPGPGGQAHRGITTTPLRQRHILGAEYWAGERLATELLASGARYVPGAVVRGVTPDLDVDASIDGASHMVQAKRVIVATGALERPFPIPGSGLRGVVMAGDAQARLMADGIVPTGRTVLAGSGPMLWLVAWRLLNAGASVEALLDTTPAAARRRAWPHLFGFLRSPYFATGVKLLREVRAKVRVVKEATALRAHGADKLASVEYETPAGRTASIAADNLLLHQGVVPDLSLTQSAGAEHRRDEEEDCLVPRVDARGGTNVPGLYVAGDAAGIGGAQAAAWRGVLVAGHIVAAVRPELAVPSQRYARAALARYRRGRRFIDLYFGK